MQGPLRYPRRWTLSGSSTDVTIDVGYAKLHNQGPLSFTYADQTIHILPGHMVGEGTDVVGHGSIHFVGAEELDLSADGQVDLKLLSIIAPDLTASGRTTIHMTLGGTLIEPLPQGS